MTMDLSLFKATPPAPKVVKGWILRAGRSVSYVYWTGDNALAAWGPNPADAIRFYRMQDAQRIQAMMQLHLGTVVPFDWDEAVQTPTPAAPTELSVYVVEHKN
jgi:hypothetical protein